MQEFLKNVSESYNKVAKDYRVFANELDHKPLDRDLLSRFSKLTDGQGKVCDLGCGPGQIAAYLKGLGSNVIGVDLSENMIEEAKSLHDNIEFLAGDMFNLSFLNEELAGVAAFYSIVNIPLDRLRDAFLEIHRVLKSAGTFLISFHIGNNEEKHITTFLEQDVSLNFYFFEPESIIELLEETGFNVDEVIIRFPYKALEFQSKRAYLFATKKF